MSSQSYKSRAKLIQFGIACNKNLNFVGTLYPLSLFPKHLLPFQFQAQSNWNTGMQSPFYQTQWEKTVSIRKFVAVKFGPELFNGFPKFGFVVRK